MLYWCLVNNTQYRSICYKSLCVEACDRQLSLVAYTLLWRHSGRDDVSNHQPHDCLLNRSFRRRSKEPSKLRVTGLFAGNSTVTDEFPAQMASNAENVSFWWRHHAYQQLYERRGTRIPFHKRFRSSKLENEKVICSSYDTNDQIRSKFCGCRGVFTYIDVWPGVIIVVKKFVQDLDFEVINLLWNSFLPNYPFFEFFIYQRSVILLIPRCVKATLKSISYSSKSEQNSYRYIKNIMSWVCHKHIQFTIYWRTIIQLYT